MTIETGDDCPLCAEALDSTDKRFIPCLCGFQICLWCYRKIQESEAPRCPKCRRAYTGDFCLRSAAVASSPSDRSSDVVAEDDVGCFSSGASKVGGGRSASSELESESGMSVKPTSTSPPTSLARDLRDVRVIRRDLCYVVGLPLEVVIDEASLKCFEYFGKYGKVVNIIVNRNPNFKAPDKKKSCALYITYSCPEEAKGAIMDLDDSFYEGRRLKASYGTTKYCSNFLRRAKCQNRQCFYLHEKGADEDSFTVAEMNQVKETSRGLTCSALLASEFEHVTWKDNTSLFGKNRAQTIDYFVNTPNGRQRQPFKTLLAEVEARRQALAALSSGTGTPISCGDQSAAVEEDLSQRQSSTSDTKGVRDVSLMVIPPPPTINSDPIVHPSLQPLGWTCDFPIMPISNDGSDMDVLDGGNPGGYAKGKVDLEVQPGRLLPQAPSALLTAHVTPADQVALRTSSKYFSQVNAVESGPPGFEKYYSYTESRLISSQRHYPSPTYFTTPLMEAEYAPMRMVGMM